MTGDSKERARTLSAGGQCDDTECYVRWQTWNVHRDVQMERAIASEMRAEELEAERDAWRASARELRRQRDKESTKKQNTYDRLNAQLIKYDAAVMDAMKSLEYADSDDQMVTNALDVLRSLQRAALSDTGDAS